MVLSILLQATATGAFDTLLQTLITSGPLAAVLFFFLSKLWGRLTEKDNEIQRLNGEILEMQKGGIDAMNKLSQAVDGLKDMIKFAFKSNDKN